MVELAIMSVQNMGILVFQFTGYCQSDNIVISVVITSSNFFTGMPNTENVSVIGIEMLNELLYYANPDLDYYKLTSMIKHPISNYNFDGEPELIFSKIATENFELLYQEIE